ncbi:hypothetical protein SAMD00019534_002400 [Acytostelium subglobosum LB1]|uniref:hypothetical protein n=1 Tax=Acytostelium subglobosum LB1 TaxID=1410327 RepID=UPI0006447C61|nr:hypothetical protein SAMD00019534_002400 [Acytostelium subglobosum LB1]GAM17065.1 hypothetical protein SAMD00019534_002400 [Acytostelium subglobosum LB1]|eukprot:XP_012759127.1 hypothetical protein SAMD00019534_002400 [Acytostelium subglobosum LB1]
MGKSKGENGPLIQSDGSGSGSGSGYGSNDPYSFMYPGKGMVSSLSLEDGGANSMHNVLSHSYRSEAGSINGGGEDEESPLFGTRDENIDIQGPLPEVSKIDGTHEHKIGELLATAICGNDITSSIFYTSSLCTAAAGMYAPFSLLIVCFVLYLFRKVYGEVGSALPLNGGAYNVLLNTTSKHVASLAAALTMISYVATAVVSAFTAMKYFEGMVPSISDKPSTVVLLAAFAALNLIGIGESAIVAFIIFVFHMITLLMLVFGGFGVFFYRHDWTILVNNFHGFTPANLMPGVSEDSCLPGSFEWNNHNFAYDIFFGFGAAMLGVTGFETSSNFIEQQEVGVFPKTLRNMWAIVSFFNPLIGLLNLCFLYICQIASSTNGGVLATVAKQAMGEWFGVWISIDACLVLSGSVITSYVGIIGLVRRMALDRCLPQFLLKENPWRRTNHFIIILFFLVCTSLFVLSGFDTTVLAGVYTIAFLGVMSLFAIGNMLLKYKRSSLRREIRSPWLGVIFALCFVLTALVANIINDPSTVAYFAVYFIVTALIIMTMFVRTRLLKMLLYFSQIILAKFKKPRDRFSRWIGEMINSINSQSIVFFASKQDPAYLNKAILYIRDNEQTNWVRIVHCYDSENPPTELTANVAFLDRMYPKIRIDLITVKSSFNPQVVEKLSTMLDVQKNFMFIACPKKHLPHSMGDFGGVRMVTMY